VLAPACAAFKLRFNLSWGRCSQPSDASANRGASIPGYPRLTVGYPTEFQKGGPGMIRRDRHPTGDLGTAVTVPTFRTRGAHGHARAFTAHWHHDQRATGTLPLTVRPAGAGCTRLQPRTPPCTQAGNLNFKLAPSRAPFEFGPDCPGPFKFSAAI
jgi:hypothetical protein